MKFPSNQFYGGKLTIGISSQEMPSTLELWPSGGDQPIMFVNVVGNEIDTDCSYRTRFRKIEVQ
jgi:hypothetical protein